MINAVGKEAAAVRAAHFPWQAPPDVALPDGVNEPIPEHPGVNQLHWVHWGLHHT